MNPGIALKRIALCSAALLLGCGESLKTGEVEGRVVINGKPGHRLSIQFLPDVDQGTRGPMASGETDAEGKFFLTMLVDGNPQRGAVVGEHRVVINDLQLAESATGAGVPIRLPVQYGLAASTPVLQSVAEGKNQIEIRVP